ncbi:MAG: hypothetical protein HQL64_14075 [Magnetococcales bacterium]|nr:hypothetical protein [Magnetococcales bacterium]
MDDTLDRMEQLLNLMAEPDKVEVDRLASLSREWEGVVQLLLLESRVETYSADDRRRWRDRLEGLMQRLPDIQTGLLTYQSEVAVQIYAENRRSASLSQVREGLSVREKPLIRCRA